MLQRSRVIPNAMGKVLEIGIGSGLNLSFYDQARVTELTAIDPLDRLWNKNKTDLDALPFKVNFIQGMANRIPCKAGTFDTIVTTFTLCSVENVDQVLQELYRVLVPRGKLIFAEHGQAPDKGLLWWQNRLNPVWKHIGGGCQLNRDIPAILENNGFVVDSLHKQYLGGWKLTSYHFWGSASKG